MVLHWLFCQYSYLKWYNQRDTLTSSLMLIITFYSGIFFLLSGSTFLIQSLALFFWWYYPGGKKTFWQVGTSGYMLFMYIIWSFVLSFISLFFCIWLCLVYAYLQARMFGIMCKLHRNASEVCLLHNPYSHAYRSLEVLTMRSHFLHLSDPIGLCLSGAEMTWNY